MLEAIILAGGFGTRLKSAVPNLPKPMAPIGNRPFLEIIIANLSKKGFSKIILAIGFMAEKISEYFGDNFADIELIYVVENSPLGTGGAIRLAIEQCTQDHVYIFNGDTYLDLEISEVEQKWQQDKSTIIVGREVDDTSRYGRLLVNNEKIEKFSEKGISGKGLINAGCYLLQNNELGHYPLHHPFSIETDYLANKVVNQPINLFVTNGYFIDIGIPEDYEKAQQTLTNLV
jgi:D-glycero-alpha-D-manno-heptose 1-phosphate guanylyltransferase